MFGQNRRFKDIRRGLPEGIGELREEVCTQSAAGGACGVGRHGYGEMHKVQRARYAGDKEEYQFLRLLSSCRRNTET